MNVCVYPNGDLAAIAAAVLIAGIVLLWRLTDFFLSGLV